eukprot:3667644-Rhodomonas_salina.7
MHPPILAGGHVYSSLRRVERVSHPPPNAYPARERAFLTFSTPSPGSLPGRWAVPTRLVPAREPAIQCAGLLMAPRVRCLRCCDCVDGVTAGPGRVHLPVLGHVHDLRARQPPLRRHQPPPHGTSRAAFRALEVCAAARACERASCGVQRLFPERLSVCLSASASACASGSLGTRHVRIASGKLACARPVTAHARGVSRGSPGQRSAGAGPRGWAGCASEGAHQRGARRPNARCSGKFSWRITCGWATERPCPGSEPWRWCGLAAVRIGDRRQRTASAAGRASLSIAAGVPPQLQPLSKPPHIGTAHIMIPGPPSSSVSRIMIALQLEPDSGPGVPPPLSLAL